MKLRFTADHEWVGIEGNTATVGITDHAQRELGDLVFVQLPAVGAHVAKGAVAGVVESVKAASDLFAPVSGTVIAANPTVVDSPELVNAQPMTEGWLFKLDMSDAAEVDALMDAAAYGKISS